MFLIQRNRHALLGRAMDQQDMKRVLDFLESDPVISSILPEDKCLIGDFVKATYLDYASLGCGWCLRLQNGCHWTKVLQIQSGNR